MPPADLKTKVKKLLDSKQARCSNSAQVSKSESTAQPLGSCTDQITDKSKVNTELLADTKNTELLTDTEICALMDKKSIKQVINQFTPLIQAVLQNIDMCKDWDTNSLADTLGFSRTDMKDILEGKHSQNVMPYILGNDTKYIVLRG